MSFSFPLWKRAWGAAKRTQPSQPSLATPPKIKTRMSMSAWMYIYNLTACFPSFFGTEVMIVHMLTGRVGLYKTLDFAEEFQTLQSLKVKKTVKNIMDIQ